MDAILAALSKPMEDCENNDTCLYYDQVLEDALLYLSRVRETRMIAAQWRIVNTFCNYFSFVLCTCGFVANVLTIKVHKRLGFKDYKNTLVTSMALSDDLLLLTYVLEHVHIIVKDADTTWYNYLVLAFMHLFYPWRFRAWCFGLWLMALLSVERVIATFFPTRVARIVTPKKLIVVVGVLLGLVIIFTFPNLYLFYEYVIRDKKYAKEPSFLMMVAPENTMRYIALLCSLTVVYIPWAVIGISLITVCISFPFLRFKTPGAKKSITDFKNLKQIKLLFLLWAIRLITLIPAALELMNDLFDFYSKALPVMSNFNRHTTKLFIILFASSSFCVCVTCNSKFAVVFKRMLKLHN